MRPERSLVHLAVGLQKRGAQRGDLLARWNITDEMNARSAKHS